MYLDEGDASVGGDDQALKHRGEGPLSDCDSVRVQEGDADARFLLLAGNPLGESLVQDGPFVMNSRAKIVRAVPDYQTGRLTGSREAAER